MQRLLGQRNGRSKAGIFELEIWILAGCALVVTLAGLFRYVGGHEGLFTFVTGSALFLLLLIISARYRKHVVSIQTFIENIPFDMWMSGKDGRFILQSGESYRLMGDRIGKTPDDLGLPTEALVEWKANELRVLNGETIYKEGSRVVDGKTHDIFTIMTPVKNGEEFVGSVGINLNITERKKVERQLRRTAEQLTILNDIARAITTVSDVDSVLNLIRMQAQRLLPVDAFLVILYQPDINKVTYPLVFDNGRNWSEPDHELTLDMRLYEILKTGKSLLLNLTEEEFEKLSQNKSRSLVGDRTSRYRSFIYAPLVGLNEVIGVISAISYNFNTYNHKHLELLESFALQATIAIENARLFQAQQKEIAERKQAVQETQRLNEELEERVKSRTLQLQEANLNLNFEKARLEKYNRQREIMTDMTDMLQASLDTPEASEVIAAHLKMLFPNNDGALYLLNELGLYEPISIWGTQPLLNVTFTAEDCWALRRGRSYRFEAEQSNPPCSHLGKNPAQHTLCIPLSAQGEGFGSLHISTSDETRKELMDIEEQRFMESVANSVALALANLRLREKLRLQSTRDVLTGLYNRRYLDETLPREINRARREKQPLSILLFDIDHFKRFNDKHGHHAGDFVLENISSTLLSFIRESDIACRYGGEEFMVILPNTSLETAQIRAETLREQVSKNELKFNGQFLGAITISIGVAAYPQHGNQENALVKSADVALYAAKQNGRNRVVVSI